VRDRVLIPLSDRPAIPARLSLEFPPQTGCRVENLKDLVLTPGTAKGVNVDVTVQPGVVGTFHVPVRCTVEGGGWKLRGRGRMKVGDEWCGRIIQWPKAKARPLSSRRNGAT
jgi:hypothetical protein